MSRISGAGAVTHASASPARGGADGPTPAVRARRLHWLRRLGFAGFLFFLAKGLLWLTLPLLLAYGCGGGW